MLQKNNNTIRILQVFASLDRGGAETMIMNLYRTIDRTKIQFDFVVNESGTSYAYEEEIMALGGHIYRLPRYKILNIYKYKKAWRQLLRDHPEWNIIHGHHTSPALVYIPIAKKEKRLTIAHSHIGGSDRTLKTYVKRLMRLPLRHSADVLFACSSSAAQWMFGRRCTNVRIINNAINSKQFKYNQSARVSVRREFCIGDRLVVGHIGRFAMQKNHHFLIKVFNELCAIHPDAVLFLVGEGELKKNIENDVINFGLQDNVIFTGARADISELLSAMDVFLFPSFYEGLPVTVIEAQANSLPIIASDGISDEVIITDLIELISLDNSAEYWAEQALKSAKKKRSIGNYSEIVRDCGYDVINNAKLLQEFYLNVEI